MIDCNDFGIPHNRRLVSKYYCLLAMVTFQNTEQRHKKYIQQTIIDKFKVIFL
jgi:hypothetical protein